MNTPMKKPTTELTTLADRANDHHRAAKEAARTALEHARDAGKALEAAKQKVDHGEWTTWLEDHFEASPRTARLYMRIARRWSELEAATENGNALPIREAAGLLRSGDSDDRDEETGPDAGPTEVAERIWNVLEPGEATYVTFPDWFFGIDYGWIWPADRERFFWVTFMEHPSGPDELSTVRSFNRPMHGGAIPVVLEAFRIPIEECEWKSIGSVKPKDHNHFLFGSRDEQLQDERESWHRG